ncbi:MAG: 5-formyltetrahydrofolate cyclo-ligase [Chromatiales bacterium]|jgi:5-formyltetrahydrofolate cyclo-ligase
MKQTNAQIRKHIRRRRSQLSDKQQQLHQQAVLTHLMSLPRFINAKRIAIYLHGDGELHTNLIIERIFHLNKHCYLPALYPFGHNKLWFLPFKKNQPLKKNRFNIAEPIQIKQRIKPWALDIICMPLVAFDASGNRIGMGGGFYDRTLSACKTQGEIKKPVLIGLAHECQYVESIDHNEWDIPMHAVITEKQARVFSQALF